jgi:hypothetical protein
VDTNTLELDDHSAERTRRVRPLVLGAALGAALTIAGTTGIVNASRPAAPVHLGKPSTSATVAGHAVTYIPTHPYVLSLGTGTCSTATKQDDSACWSPLDLEEKDAYAVGPVPTMANVQLRLTIGAGQQFAGIAASEPDPGFTNETIAVGGRPAVLREADHATTLSWTLYDSQTASLIALNIPRADVVAFTEGVR